MTRTTPRAALTDCAAHVRDVYGPDAADLIEVWRDRHYPELAAVVHHRWTRVGYRVDGVWVDRRCVRCGIRDQFGPLEGREVAHYVLPDGSTAQKAKSPTPPCRPLSAAALSTNRSTKD